MVPLGALATSRRGPWEWVPGTSASPVGNCPFWRARVTVVLRGVVSGVVPGAQPVMRPFGTGSEPEEALATASLNMNLGGTRPSPLCWLPLKALPPLNTIPVGDEASTSSGTLAILSLPLAPAYSVTFVVRSTGKFGLNWLLTHSGVGELLGPNAMPQ